VFAFLANLMVVLKFLLLFMICNRCIIGETLIKVDGSNGNDSADCVNNAKGSPACKTLDFTLSNLPDCQSKPIIISIQNGTYNYSLNATKSTWQIWNCSNISITGISNSYSTICCNEPGAGFAFFNSLVVLQDITFEFCGSSQNGTSHNTTTNTTSMVSAALYFSSCNVSIIGSVIQGSNNIGVVMYNTRYLNVTNSKFIGNQNNHTTYTAAGGGGFYAEFTFCDPGLTNNCVQNTYSDAIYVFESSVFSFNVASDGLETNNTFILANGTTNIAFGRGGGLSLIFKGNVTNSFITISNCNISFNHATWGAGLFVEFQDNSKHNRVFVNHTTLNDNVCELAFRQNYGTGGGGARIGFISFLPYKVQNNTISFESCKFLNNDAYWGGGLSYYTFREANTMEATNKVSFTNCSWRQNRAVLGSAIDLSLWHSIKTGVLSAVLFTDCNFTENENRASHVYTTYYTETSLGTGAFYSDSIPVAFQNVVYFQDNVGSAMALSAAGANFMQGCMSYFLCNSGWTGGAIALLGNAWLKINDKTNFTFYKNSAILTGGAISVVISSRHDLLSSRNCFLQYHDQFTNPENWDTYFNFTNNTAPNGPSIFATSLLSCVWGNSQGKLINGTSIVPFNWSIIHTSGKILDEISSAISKINFSPGISNNNIDINDTNLVAVPGQPTKLPLNFTDDTHRLVQNSIYLLPEQGKNISVASNITADYSVILLGPENNISTLQVVTDGPRIVSKNMTVRLVSCPPGYFWSSTAKNNVTGKCICGYEHGHSWSGILYCNDSEFRAYIEKDYWAGYIPNTSVKISNENLYSGKCPKNYCSTSGTALLPNSSNYLDKMMCKNQNRTGILCGECLDNYCVAINSRYYKCTNNVHKYKWVILLATEYLPSTILLMIILFYDINLHSGSLGSVIMYFQVYSSLNIYSDGEISSPKNSYYLNKVIDFLYNIWNLEYIGIWLPPYCLAKDFNTMQVLMVSYLSGIYPFVLILIYVLLGTFKRFSFCNPCTNFCIRLRWRTSLKASIINGLSTFWTLAYTKLALVSCLLLSIHYLEGRSDLSYPIKSVVALQGNFDYFDKHHLPYAITALFVLVFFVILPSLALICYPLITRIMAMIKKYIDLDKYRAYAYISDKMERPFIRCKPLLDSFQGRYKPGCEFFAGLMFWYRLGIFFTYSFASDSKVFYINSVISLAFVTLIAFFQPFKKQKNNTVTLLITVDIALINLISLYNYYEDISNVMSWFQLLLTILPMIYFTGYAILKIKRQIQDYIQCAPPSGLYTRIPSSESQEFDDSLLQNMA